MDINIPDVVNEVTDALMQYEEALRTNDVDMINTLFWDSPWTIRYGPNGTLLGSEALAAFRKGRKAPQAARTLQNTVITTFGRDFAVANTEKIRPGSESISRQSHTWVRMPAGWRIVAAHVSELPDP